MVTKTWVVLSKKGGVWTDQLMLTDTSGCGQSSCYYLAFLLSRFYWIWERESFDSAEAATKGLNEDLRLFSPWLFYPLEYWFCRFVFRLIENTLYFIYYTCYIFTLTSWVDIFRYSRIQIGRQRDIEIYLVFWDVGTWVPGKVTLLTLIYLPTDSQFYSDGQTWWQQRIRIVRPRERGNRPKALVWGYFIYMIIRPGFWLNG